MLFFVVFCCIFVVVFLLYLFYLAWAVYFAQLC